MKKNFINYGKQFIDYKDKNLVLNSLRNELITTGPYVKKFENELNKFLKCRYSYVCNSGTSAIHLALLSLNLKKNDIILMPAINFIASYNLAKSLNLKVFLVDVDSITGQITPKNVLNCIKQNKIRNIRVLIHMHHGGYPQNIQEFFRLKKRYNFFIIEDACHALGSEYKNGSKFFKIGSCKHSDISTFSLHPLKSITSGEGGIITTNNHIISKNIKLFRSHGIVRDKKKHWKYDVIKNGFNYRISDINCALGLSQLKKINFFLKQRKKIYQKYSREFNDFNLDLSIPKYPDNIKPAYHLFMININFINLKKNKDHFMKYLKDRAIIAQSHYIPIYKFNIYNEKKINLTGAEKFYKQTVSIPIYVGLSVSDQNRVINIIKNYFKNN